MSEGRKKKQIVAGDIRPSQLIHGFGPGSIISMENDAVMILGCQAWPKKDDEQKRYEILIHPLLSKILGVREIRMPFSRDKSRVIPAISFPQWGVCKNKECQILQKHERIPRSKNGFSCIHCDKKGKYGKIIHARLVVICEKGHIDEFPWVEWLHRNLPDQKCPNSKKPMMRFYSQEKSSGLGDYAIKCKNCPAWSSLSGSTDKSKFVLMPRCSGRSPWLPEYTVDSEPCMNEKTHEPSIVRGVQIRAPSLYYPVGMSAIKIPQWTHPVYDRLLDPNDEGRLRDTVDTLRKNNMEFSQIIETLRTDFQPIENITSEQKKNEGLSVSDEIIRNEIIEKLKKLFEENNDDEVPSQIEILNQEFDDIASIADTKGKSYEDEFQLKTSDINEQEILKEYLSSLKQITRITSISALQGFTRAEPPDPLAPDKEKIRPIVTKKFFHDHKWLPGIQNKGEGVFISLDIEKLKKWENLEDVKERCNTLIENHAMMSQPKDEEKRKEVEERYNARYILLHTLSHIIIKTMSKHAGYNEASIQERIYWDGKDRNGILMYASSGTSEGSLGGLVRLGQPDEFARILNDAIKKSQSCSKDPICGESDPVEDKKNGLDSYMRLSGAACHSCSIVAETSCSFFNHFLDRRLIMDKEFGFFKDIIR